MNSRITLLPAFERREELIPLYEEYAAMLVRVEPIFTKSLDQQNYDEEIARLEEQNRQLMQMMAPQPVEAPVEQPSLALVDPSQASVEFQQQYQQLEQNPLFPYVQTAQPQFPVR